MIQVNINEAKSKFLDLINKAENGEEIVLFDENHEIARIVPAVKVKGQRKLGMAKGKIKMGDDFFDPLPDDILTEFYK